MTAWNGLRAWAAVANWDILSRFRANPTYIFATGIFWLVVGISLIVLLLKSSRVAPACGLAASVLYLAWYWVDRLMIQAMPETNIPFSIVVSASVLILFNLHLFWPSSQAFFKESQ